MVLDRKDGKVELTFLPYGITKLVRISETINVTYIPTLNSFGLLAMASAMAASSVDVGDLLLFSIL